MRIAINGFGRIGRSVLRQILTGSEHADIDIVCINDIAPLETLAYLFRYDSTYGPWPYAVTVDRGHLVLGERRIPVTRMHDAHDMALTGVDVLLECTGKAQTQRAATAGLAAGAARILVSGPCPFADKTVVLGANEETLGDERVVSNASCTTNAIAPIVRILDKTFTLFHGHVTTVHCYTNSQPLVDGPRGSHARSRAAAVSMIPTSTSATELTAEVLPHLAGRLSGAAIRVPTPSVSCIDAVMTFVEPLGEDALHSLRAMAEASPVLGWTDEHLVSSDLRGRTESLIISAPETMITGEYQLRLFGWYDNEWGFAARMLDMARRMTHP